MTAARKKFGLTLLVNDATFRAIGHVAAQWAVLEIEFDFLLNQFLRHPEATELLPGKFPQAFDRRAKLFRDCAKITLRDQPSLREGLTAIINDACSARGHRDSVIHGQWHLGRKKGAAVTIINQRPKFKAEIKNMSSEQIEDVAATISQVTSRLIWWRTMNVTYQEQA
jgi:hypothetical protein